MPSQSSLRHHALGALAAIALTTALIPSFADAQPLYDGAWQVSILTKKGECSSSQRYPVQITDGALGTTGSAGFAISGKVNGSGHVTVTVRNGDKSATGHGRLAGRSGGGTWTGEACSGTWSAARWHNGRAVAVDRAAAAVD